MEQCNACVDPQGEGKTSCQDMNMGENRSSFLVVFIFCCLAFRVQHMQLS